MADENIPHAELLEKILVFLRDAVSPGIMESDWSRCGLWFGRPGNPLTRLGHGSSIGAENLPGGRLKRMEEFRPFGKAYEAFIETGAGGRVSGWVSRRLSRPPMR